MVAMEESLKAVTWLDISLSSYGSSRWDAHIEKHSKKTKSQDSKSAITVALHRIWDGPRGGGGMPSLE